MIEKQHDPIEALRQRAEALMHAAQEHSGLPPAEDYQQVFHELQVHQIELELQNEELRTAQKALEESRSRYMRLFHHAPVGYVVLDASGIITESNATFADMVGRDRARLLGKPLATFFLAEDRPLFLARFKALFKNPEDKLLELRLDAGTVWRRHVCLSAGPHQPSGQPGASLQPELSLMITEITERKKGEDKLRASETFARSTVDALAANIAILNADGEILFVNRAWRNFARSNNTDPALVGEGCNYFTLCGNARGGESAEAAQFAAGIRAVIRGEIDFYTQEYPCHSPEENRWFVGRVTRFPAPGDQRVVVAHENITQRKQLEKDNFELQRQLHRQDKEESLGRMAGAIAHHYNNLLFAVMGNLELAMDDAGDSPTGHTLKLAMDSAVKAAELSNRMLTYLGMNTRGKERFDLSAACRRTLTTLLAFKPGGVAIEADFPAAGPHLIANPDQICEILTNLVENSWEAMPNQTGAIRLAVELTPADAVPDVHRFPLAWRARVPAYACLRVEDTGCGIRGEDIERIFDPFYSGKFMGRGMGLPLVLGILRAHGGCVVISSRPGRGATVRVYLPLPEGERQ